MGKGHRVRLQNRCVPQVTKARAFYDGGRGGGEETSQIGCCVVEATCVMHRMDAKRAEVSLIQSQQCMGISLVVAKISSGFIRAVFIAQKDRKLCYYLLAVRDEGRFRGFQESWLGSHMF